VRILFVFGDDVELAAQGAGCLLWISGNRDRAAGCIRRVIFRDQPKIIENLR
jgi:hypothetical protein